MPLSPAAVECLRTIARTLLEIEEARRDVKAHMGTRDADAAAARYYEAKRAHDVAGRRLSLELRATRLVEQLRREQPSEPGNECLIDEHGVCRTHDMPCAWVDGEWDCATSRAIEAAHQRSA